MSTDDHLGQPIATCHPTDLEAIVTLLTLAALYPSPGARFTFEQLLTQARDIGGDELIIDAADARIVLASSKFLTKKAGKYTLR